MEECQIVRLRSQGIISVKSVIYRNSSAAAGRRPLSSKPVGNDYARPQQQNVFKDYSTTKQDTDSKDRTSVKRLQSIIYLV